MAFDLFLSHNSHDKPLVRELAARLDARGIRVWLDEQQLIPGHNWQPLLERGIADSGAGAVLVGGDGLGPWEDEEMQGLLRQAVRHGKAVIPVLLPGCPREPELPLFLANRTWVDLRGGIDEAGLDRLIWGITGKRPEGSIEHGNGDGTPTGHRRIIAAGVLVAVVLAVIPSPPVTPGSGSSYTGKDDSRKGAETQKVKTARTQAFVSVSREARIIGRLTAWLLLTGLLIQPAQALELNGRVLALTDDDRQTPVANTGVRLEQGAPTLTNSRGLFRMQLPGLIPGAPIRLLIEHAGHVLYRPLDGRLNLPAPAPAPPGWPARITELHLLPRGDLRLLEGARIQLAIEQIKRDALDQIRLDGGPDEIDFTSYLRDLGAELGFRLNDIERAINDWKTRVRANLALAYAELDDDACLAATIEQLLRIKPDNRDLYNLAQGLYHGILFDFDAAYRLTAGWVDGHPDDLGVRCNLAEAALTAGRTEQARNLLAELLALDGLDPGTAAALRLLELTGRLLSLPPDASEQVRTAALSKPLAALRALVSVQPKAWRVDWNFAGASRFVTDGTLPDTDRELLLKLFGAAANGRAALLEVIDRNGWD